MARETYLYHEGQQLCSHHDEGFGRIKHPSCLPLNTPFQTLHHTTLVSLVSLRVVAKHVIVKGTAAQCHPQNEDQYPNFKHFQLDLHFLNSHAKFSNLLL